MIDGGAEAVDVTGTQNQPVVYRVLESPQSSDFYVGYLLRLVSGAWTDTDTLSFHVSNGGGNITTLNFGVRGTTFMVRNGTGAPLAGDTFGAAAFDSTYYLVARVSKPAGSSTFDRMEVWLNPGLNSSNAPDAGLTLTASAGLSTISHVILRAAALEGTDTVRVDELRLGTTWADMISPAPNRTHRNLADPHATRQPGPGAGI